MRKPLILRALAWFIMLGACAKAKDIPTLPVTAFPETTLYTVKTERYGEPPSSDCIYFQEARRIRLPVLSGFQYYYSIDLQGETLDAVLARKIDVARHYRIPLTIQQAATARFGSIALVEANREAFIALSNEQLFVRLPPTTEIYSVTPTAKRGRIAAIIDNGDDQHTLLLIDAKSKQVRRKFAFHQFLFIESEFVWLDDRYLFLSSYHHNSASYSILDAEKGRVVQGKQESVERADSGKIYRSSEDQKAKLIFDPSKH